MRLATKFSLTFLAGILVVHVGSAVFRVQREQELFEQDIAHDSRVLGRALAHAVRREWQTRGEQAALALVGDATDWESGNSIRWVWLDPPSADVVDESLERARRPVVPLATLGELGERGRSTLHEVDGESSVYTYVPVEAPGSGGRRLALEIQDPLVDENRYVWRSVVNSAIATVLLVALASLLSWALGYVLIVKRVGRLVEQARRIGEGDLAGGVDLPGGDELAELAREMDVMCAGLRRAVERARVESENRSLAEEQLRHADRLTTAGTLASGMAHELGTPINVIEGYAQMIREDEESSPSTRESAEIVLEQCRRMAQIIQQLLNFTRRGGTTRGASVRASVDALEVLQETLRLIDPMVRRLGVETNLVASSDRSIVGIGATPLQQVLTNLLINGLQAMKMGGTLSVGLDRRRLPHPGRTPPAPEEFVSICVEDTGEGMDARVAERVFEPFFTTKDVGEGTGLGLSVAYGIVSDHGGWIDVHSEPGSGSSFTVYLPGGQLA